MFYKRWHKHSQALYKLLTVGSSYKVLPVVPHKQLAGGIQSDSSLHVFNNTTKCRTTVPCIKTDLCDSGAAALALNSRELCRRERQLLKLR